MISMLNYSSLRRLCTTESSNLQHNEDNPSVSRVASTSSVMLAQGLRLRGGAEMASPVSPFSSRSVLFLFPCPSSGTWQGLFKEYDSCLNPSWV